MLTPEQKQLAAQWLVEKLRERSDTAAQKKLLTNDRSQNKNLT